MIHACTCHNIYQDSLYGKGNRVFNLQGSKNAGFYRCTICDRSIDLRHQEIKPITTSDDEKSS